VAVVVGLKLILSDIVKNERHYLRKEKEAVSIVNDK